MMQCNPSISNWLTSFSSLSALEITTRGFSATGVVSAFGSHFELTFRSAAERISMAPAATPADPAASPSPVCRLAARC